MHCDPDQYDTLAEEWTVFKTSYLFLCLVELAQQHGRYEQPAGHTARRRRDGRQLPQSVPK